MVEADEQRATLDILLDDEMCLMIEHDGNLIVLREHTNTKGVGEFT
jgi:hypothetical protein